jgi:membrane-associated phospholipid phosphatase
MFYCLPERKLVGVIFLVYACLVALATVYGRYHFALDAVAGFAVSIGGLAISRLLFRREAARQSEPVITTPLG